MTLDIVWIDAEITRLQKLREIAADPQMMALMERASLKVASSTDSKPNDSASEDSFDEDDFEKYEGGPTPPGVRRTKKGELKKIVTEAVTRQTDWFDGYALTNSIKATGYSFVSANPAISVNDILRGMAANGALEVRVGLGSAPNLYRIAAKETQGGL